MAPVKLTIKKQEVVMDTDEHPRPQTTIEGLAKLPTLFKKNGLVTSIVFWGHVQVYHEYMV